MKIHLDGGGGGQQYGTNHGRTVIVLRYSLKSKSWTDSLLSLSMCLRRSDASCDGAVVQGALQAIEHEQRHEEIADEESGAPSSCSVSFLASPDRG